MRLAHGGEEALFPERPAITRFKGAVSAAILSPHIAAMFTGMLVANAAGLLALRGEKRLFRISLVVIALLSIGGLFLGPLVQKAAFGAYWTGWPFGSDLTDNKTAVAVLAWVVAAFRSRGERDARIAVGARGDRHSRRLHGPPQRVGVAGRLVEGEGGRIRRGRRLSGAAPTPGG